MILQYPIKRSTLAKDVYRIGTNAFKTWLIDIEITHQHTLSPADVKKIIKNYDLPDGWVIKWN